MTTKPSGGEELLPCPFCGGRPAYTRDGNGIGCTNCWAEGPVTVPEGLAAEWNTRALTKATDTAGGGNG